MNEAGVDDFSRQAVQGNDARQDDPNPGSYPLFDGDFYGSSTMIQQVGGSVPEPASLALVALSLLALGVARRHGKG